MSDETDTIVAIVALVIAITSFIVTGAQALQQYIASADGYRRCAPDVMGEWAQSRRRRFRWRELRFDVLFETPVIFLAGPDNTRGPIADRELYNIDGKTAIFPQRQRRPPLMMRSSSSLHAAHRKAADPSRVSTADDERASWVNLLSSLDRLEREGRQWDAAASASARGYRREAAACVAQVQRRRRNWDFMPDSVVKPYATSTITHVLELAVLLGMSWKTVRPDSGVLRAEGNGMSLSSTDVQGLGLVVSFAVTGRSSFGRDRVIPCKGFARLVFGMVQSDFIECLEFGDDRGIRRTLKCLRCRRDIINKYLSRRDHVRSLSFEVLAMLGKVFRLRGSSLRMLPNPTRDPWSKALSSCALMEQFQEKLASLDGPLGQSKQAVAIKDEWSDNLRKVWKSDDSLIDIDLLEAVHTAVDACDAFFKSCGSDAVLAVVSAHLSAVVDELADSRSFLGSRDYDTEEDVVTEYFKKILPKCAKLTTHIHKGTIVPSSEKVDSAEIWLTLQFRSCCWLLLHDFKEDDALVVDPAMQGSRLPVFIL